MRLLKSLSDVCARQIYQHDILSNSYKHTDMRHDLKTHFYVLTTLLRIYIYENGERKRNECVNAYI